MSGSITFDDEHYARIMGEFGYSPLQFGKINFSLGTFTSEDLQRKWLCHHEGDAFAKRFSEKEPAMVSTGFGLSGVPHAGTLSQILRSIALQKAGVPVQMVLGDLDAYNGKSKPLSETLRLADRYGEFITKLGFDSTSPSILRSQFDSLDVLQTAYLIGHYMDDAMFNEAEEDLHELYSNLGKVDSDMSYRRKLSLNLMTADFINLNCRQGVNSVLVMLGVDEHKYVQFGRSVVERMKANSSIVSSNLVLGGLYSPMIKGFYDFPKMSKSFPQSGISVDMSADEISRRIMEGEGHSNKPENNVVYQMMSAASYLDHGQLKEAYEACLSGGKKWRAAKSNYAEMLVDICREWR